MDEYSQAKIRIADKVADALVRLLDKLTALVGRDATRPW